MFFLVRNVLSDDVFDINSVLKETYNLWKLINMFDYVYARMQMEVQRRLHEQIEVSQSLVFFNNLAANVWFINFSLERFHLVSIFYIMLRMN